jgi:hypothetical protein
MLCPAVTAGEQPHSASPPPPGLAPHCRTPPPAHLTSAPPPPPSDAYTEQQALQRKQAASGRDCRRDGPISGRSPKAGGRAREAQVGGVFLPAQLDTHAAMAYILNQEPGRMRTKDVKVGGGGTVWLPLRVHVCVWWGGGEEVLSSYA